jgi:hypothetical protein
VVTRDHGVQIVTLTSAHRVSMLGVNHVSGSVE